MWVINMLWGSSALYVQYSGSDEQLLLLSACLCFLPLFILNSEGIIFLSVSFPSTFKTSPNSLPATSSVLCPYFTSGLWLQASAPALPHPVSFWGSHHQFAILCPCFVHLAPYISNVNLPNPSCYLVAVKAPSSHLVWTGIRACPQWPSPRTW